MAISIPLKITPLGLDEISKPSFKYFLKQVANRYRNEKPYWIWYQLCLATAWILTFDENYSLTPMEDELGEFIEVNHNLLMSIIVSHTGIKQGD